MAEKKKKEYIAVQGINFDELKGKPRVEPGESIPDGVDPKVIAELLANGAIKERE